MRRAASRVLPVRLSWMTSARMPSCSPARSVAVKHLAWAEDRWFQGRLLGKRMPVPWDSPDSDDPDASMRLTPGDTIEGIVELYMVACERSRAAAAQCNSLSQPAVVPSFGIGPVNLRWILVHMIDETARHAGHLDLLDDALRSE
ncbi:MAG: DUF664 domain-containing protein [Microthrixaceae bacterium]